MCQNFCTDSNSRCLNLGAFVLRHFNKTSFLGKCCCQMDTYQSKHQLAPCFGKHESWVGFLLERSELLENVCISFFPLDLMGYMEGDSTVREGVSISWLHHAKRHVLSNTLCVEVKVCGCLCSLFRFYTFFNSQSKITF